MSNHSKIFSSIQENYKKIQEPVEEAAREDEPHGKVPNKDRTKDQKKEDDKAVKSWHKNKSKETKESVEKPEDLEEAAVASPEEHVDRVKTYLSTFIAPRAMSNLDLDDDVFEEEDKIFKIGGVTIGAEELGPLEPAFAKLRLEISAGYFENTTALFLEYTWKTVNKSSDKLRVRLQSDGTEWYTA